MCCWRVGHVHAGNAKLFDILCVMCLCAVLLCSSKSINVNRFIGNLKKIAKIFVFKSIFNFREESDVKDCKQRKQTQKEHYQFNM